MNRHIVACGGGGWSSDGRPGPVEDYILGLAGAARPRVCLLPTASGDSDWLVARFYDAFARLECEPSHLALFRAHPDAAAPRLLAADVIYVGGGSSANLMAVWEVHGLGPVLSEAWRRGVVLAGVSAGAICWFEAGLTNSLGAGFAAVRGLGVVGGGFCPHADSDPGRLDVLRGLVDSGRMPPTLAVDDDAAVHLTGDGPPVLLSARPGRSARRIEPDGVEEPLEALALGA
ncbi:MAG: Type 1 glutamine amidotransferase-like domain-containing protein [Thermoleophilia bacterium]